MAQIVKRCGCPQPGWAKCQHSWTVRWWDGRQQERSFKLDRKAAMAFARTAEADKLRPGHASPPRPVSLANYAETWIAGLQAPPNTVRAYRGALRNHILPGLGHRPLTEVAADREGVQALLRSLPPGAARTTLTALRAMMSEAARAGRISTDRLRQLDAGNLRPLAFTFPSAAQLTALAENLGGLGTAVWIMRGCGLRPAEVLAVRGRPAYPGGPGFSDGKLRVNQQRLGNGILAPLKARKSGDFRDVPVPGYVAEAVADTGDGYLFAISGSTFRHRFRTAASTAELPGFRAHDLRHVFASVALAGGIPVSDVSRWLGHRSIELTYRTYSHFIPSSWDVTRTILDKEYERWSTS
jgi:integrase